MSSDNSIVELNERFLTHRNIPIQSHLAVKVIEIPAIDIFGVRKSKIHPMPKKLKKIKPYLNQNSINASASIVNENLAKIKVS